MNKSQKEYEIINKYRETLIRNLRLVLPNLTDSELIEAVDYSLQKRMKNSNVRINNNYKKKEINMTVLELCEYILKREPIITAYGVLFKKHADAPNPIAKLLETFMEGRNVYKKKMFSYPKGSEDFEKYNLLQLLAKIDANGFYGACGQHSCILYNLHVAASVTTQGRSCISAAGLQFEMFLANNVKFSSFNDIVQFIDNIRMEKSQRKYDDKLILDHNISLEQCFSKIIMTCGFNYIPSKEDLDLLWEMMSRISQEDLNRIYYKNNLYEFMENKSMSNAVKYLLTHLDIAYLDPNKPAKSICVELEEFKDMLMEYVYYSYQVIDRLDRYDNMIRSVCCITDTDSTIISLDPWYRYILEKVKDIDMKIKHEFLHPIKYFEMDEFGDLEHLPKPIIKIEPDIEYDFYNDELIQIEKLASPIEIIPQEGLRYSIINILAYCLGHIINDYMEKYTKCSNSWSPDRKCLLIMKNEFLFKRMLLTEAKKNYASIQEVQEGNIIPKGKGTDIKGLAMKKSTVNKQTQERLEEILYEDILNAGEQIDQVKVLKDLAKFEKEIFESLRNGYKTFYKPHRIKSINSYENPMRVFGIKQAIAWNSIRGEHLEAIDLEERNSIDIVKVNITPKNIDEIKDVYPNEYEKMKNLMNNDPNFGVGINGIGIPKNVDVPEWVIKFIDYTSIINDNLKLFPIEPLGIYRGNDNNNYTNIISL